jgi:hypothetical protein
MDAPVTVGRLTGDPRLDLVDKLCLGLWATSSPLPGPLRCRVHGQIGAVRSFWGPLQIPHLPSEGIISGSNPAISRADVIGNPSPSPKGGLLYHWNTSGYNRGGDPWSLSCFGEPIVEQHRC